MSMDSIPMRKRSRKPKHVYNAADVAPPHGSSVYKPVKKVLSEIHLQLTQQGCNVIYCAGNNDGSVLA